MNVQPRGATGFISRTGRPPRTATLRELASGYDRIDQRIALMDTAYREAIAGNVRWAMFIAQVSGELASVQVNVLTDSPMMQAIQGMRAALGLPALGDPHATNADAIEGEATVVDTDPAES